MESSIIIENSKITDKGEIVPKYSKFLRSKLQKEKTILILGSGYVVAPVIDFFKMKPVRIVIGTGTPEEAEKQFKSNSVDVIEVDVLKDKTLLNSLIQSSDIVIR